MTLRQLPTFPAANLSNKFARAQEPPHARGRVPVTASTGALCTKECIDLATHAANAAATACEFRATERELMAEMRDASKLPIMFYNIPSASGPTFSTQEIAGLSEVGVQYLKEQCNKAISVL